MNQEQELTKLGKALRTAVQEQAEKSNTLDIGTLRTMAVQHIKQAEYNKQKKQRFACASLLPAAAILLIIAAIIIPSIQNLQYEQVTVKSTQAYIESIIPERSLWIHETLFGTTEKSYIDEYIESIMESETIYNCF